MSNVAISDIRLQMSFDDQGGPVQHPAKEEISLFYQSITWAWARGGITASDAWADQA